MGAHSYLQIGGAWMYAAREGYVPELAALFLDAEAEHREEGGVAYVATASRIRDRLSCLGFSSSMAVRSLAERESALRADRAPLPGPADWVPYADWADAAARDAGDRSEDALPEAGDPPGWTWALDPRIVVRPLLDRLPPDLPVVLDLTEVSSRGYVAVDPEWCRRALDEAGGGRGPLIVMTEGRTDASVIERAIAVLAPHLVGYLRVLDYDLKPEGGASALVRGVRAFAAAGIRNNVVALFDNDAAAADARRPLRATTLPGNFRICALPHVAIAVSYPTLGPAGPGEADVNGSAVAIEMLFGRDVLEGGDGRLAPVQWQSYLPGVGRYQGELVDKGALQRRFDAKAAAAMERGGPAAGEDWEPLRALLAELVGAFDRDF